VTRLAIGDSDSNGLPVGSQLFTVRTVQLTKTPTQERFGPVSVIVRYGSEAELLLHSPVASTMSSCCRVRSTVLRTNVGRTVG
jgi:hypothetical protein